MSAQNKASPNQQQISLMHNLQSFGRLPQMGIEQDEADINEIFEAKLSPIDPGLFDDEDIGEVEDETYRPKESQTSLIAKVSSTQRLATHKIETDRYDTFGENEHSSRKYLPNSRYSSNANNSPRNMPLIAKAKISRE